MRVVISSVTSMATRTAYRVRREKSMYISVHPHFCQLASARYMPDPPLTAKPASLQIQSSKLS